MRYLIVNHLANCARLPKCTLAQVKRKRVHTDANGCKRAQTGANGCKQMQTDANGCKRTQMDAQVQTSASRTQLEQTQTHGGNGSKLKLTKPNVSQFKQTEPKSIKAQSKSNR